MATLHMDTEVARNVSDKMNQAVDSIHEILLDLNDDISAFVGSAWAGNSSVQFESDFSEWRGEVIQMAEQLETLKNRLEAEIVGWESMASKLE